jgi:hypothetical protein
MIQARGETPGHSVAPAEGASTHSVAAKMYELPSYLACSMRKFKETVLRRTSGALAIHKPGV